MKKNIDFCFTDLSLLQVLQRDYQDSYLHRGENKTKYYLPIDCDAVAKQLSTDGELVFQRLNFHLNKKYSYSQTNSTRVEFFAMEIGGVRHCINYPYLCAILANLKDEERKSRKTRIIALISIDISLLSLLMQAM